jgi:hypothetical protein
MIGANKMNLGDFRQTIGGLERKFTDEPMTMVGILVAALLVILIFGGLLLHAWLDRRRERQKAKAVERLLKHLESLPSSKS